MKQAICVLSLFILWAFALSVTSLAEDARPVSLVNPLMGTDSTDGFSHGNEFPAAIALPFPMNAWALHPTATGFILLSIPQD